MGKERQRTRISSKIDRLPEEIKSKIDDMLLDTSITYEEISEWLFEECGEEISKSSVGRYALRTNKATQRLLEIQQQTNQLVKAIRANPDEDYTGAATHMLMGGLIEKMANAEEEFSNMPLDKVGRLVVAVSRTEAYKRKIKHDMKKKAELAFEEMEEELMKLIKSDPSLATELKAVLEKAKTKVTSDD
ncbi:phage protein Gp27 family protein [Anaerovorax sp. IOR16]|uniref:phage protein Gp27 family protein n=1 Tax=Anaerovorax sp. IOR16 TaxID=2773458 RepID=UPI0019CF9814|nr:phage protein Gp27 family protein [Anaerovorax sp. IOR16]